MRHYTMYSNSVVELYSKALFICCSSDVRSQIVSEVVAFLDEYSGSAHLRGFLGRSLVLSRVKLMFLLSLGFHGLLNNLFSILHENGRFDFLIAVLEKFLLKVKDDEGEMDVVVTSADLLSQESNVVISDALRLHYNKKKVLIINVLDVKILGGIIVRVGYLVFDFSLLRKVEDLSRISREALRV